MHQFPDGIDPYVMANKPESGLLWGISNKPLAAAGSGDTNMQAYNFRVCLSDDPANQMPITRPENYDSSPYELLLRYVEKVSATDLKPFLKMNRIPNHKVDINNNGPFSTDMIGMNYNYPNADYDTRKSIMKQHEDYTKGLLYFIGHDARMPEHLRTQMLAWGYPKDEYLENNYWSPQIYIREARRMVGEYVMTEADCLGKKMVDDGIGKAAYMMDSHNAQRVVVNGMVKNEGDVQVKGFDPYPVSYRSITPKRKECDNLLVPVCLSASHIAYGSIRMEPVFMVLAQAAALAACQAIDKKTNVQGISIRALQHEISDNPLMDNGPIEMVVDNDDLKNVIKVGGWLRQSTGAYGLSYLIDSLSNRAQIRFVPLIKKAGSYQVYVYYPRIKNMSFVNSVRLFDGKKMATKVVHFSKEILQGESSGEWVSLGVYKLPVGKKAFVEISKEKIGVPTVADAALFVPIP